MRFGDVRVPATFHGTARLLDPGETPPPPPAPARYDDLPGVFHADLDITFDLLVGLGYRPVDPSHPAYPLYLAASAASAAREPAPPDPVGGIDRHSPDALVFPFQTTTEITAAMALQYGLVAPGRATSEHGRDAALPQPVRRGLAPPPHHARAGSGGTPLPPIGDFEAFLDFLGDPSGTVPAGVTAGARQGGSGAGSGHGPGTSMSIVPPSPRLDAGAGSKDGPIREDPGASTDDPALPGPMGAGEGKPGPQLPAPGPRVAEGYGGRFVPIAPAGGSRGAGRFDTNRLANVDLNALGLGEALRSRSAARPGAPFVRASGPGPGPEADEDDIPVLSGATPSSGTGRRSLDIVMTPGAAVPPAIRVAVAAAGGGRAGQGPATSAGPADASGDVPAMLRGMREADRSPRPSGSVEVARAGGSDAATTPRLANQPAAAPPRGKDTDVMLRDEHGNPVTSQGRNVLRPASLDPKMFIRQGLADRVVYDVLGSTYEGAASQQMYLMVRLSQFGQYGPWDAQRIGGKNHSSYVDYATIAIGLYAAAFGLSQKDMLNIQNEYARFFSKFPPGTPMDKEYTHLPQKNVINTKIGYQLYEGKSITVF